MTEGGEPWLYTPSQASSSSPIYRSTTAQLNGELMVVGETGTTGNELYRFDRATAAVSLVIDLEEGQVGSDPLNLTAVEDILLFHAETVEDGRELYRTDGTAAGTRMLELVPGAESSIVYDFGRNNKIFGVYDNLGFISARYSDNGSSVNSRLAIYDSRADSLILFPTIFSPEQVISIDSNFYVINSSANMFKVSPDGSSEFFTQGPLGWYRKFEDKLMVSGRRVIGFVDLTTGVVDSVYTNPNIPTLNDTLTFRTEEALYFFTSHDSLGLGELWRTDGTAVGTVCLDVQGASGPFFRGTYASTRGGMYAVEDDFPSHFVRSLDTINDTFVPIPVSPARDQILVSWNGAAIYPATGGGVALEALPGRPSARVVGSRVAPTSSLGELYPEGDFLIARAFGNPDANYIINYLDCTDAARQETVEVCAGESLFTFGRSVSAADTFIVNTPVYRGCDTVTTVIVSVLDTTEIAIQGPDSITIGEAGTFVSTNGEVTWPDGSTAISYELTSDSLTTPGTYSFLVSTIDPVTGCLSEQSFQVELVMPVSSTRESSIQFRIAPNPACAEINLLDYQQGDKWTLLSSDGREVIAGKLANIDVSQLPRGLYWVRVQRENGIGVQKVMLK